MNPLVASQYLFLSELAFMKVHLVHPKVAPAVFVSLLILLPFTNTTLK